VSFSNLISIRTPQRWVLVVGLILIVAHRLFQQPSYRQPRRFQTPQRVFELQVPKSWKQSDQVNRIAGRFSDPRAIGDCRVCRLLDHTLTMKRAWTMCPIWHEFRHGARPGDSTTAARDGRIRGDGVIHAQQHQAAGQAFSATAVWPCQAHCHGRNGVDTLLPTATLHRLLQTSARVRAGTTLRRSRTHTLRW